MALLTRDQAVRASRTKASSIYLAEAELRHSASSPKSTSFDIFLSHSFEDAEVVLGVKVLLEGEGLSVYVDWIEDALVDRSRVNAQTADLLRSRMNHSKYLLYASSVASPDSKWMPWELGYFDGRRPGHVGVLPIVQYAGSRFEGVEYLSLYPVIEQFRFDNLGQRLGRSRNAREADLLTQLVRA